MFTLVQTILIFLVIIHIIVIVLEMKSNILGTDKDHEVEDKLYKQSSIFFFYGTIFLCQILAAYLSWSTITLTLIGTSIFLGGLFLRRFAIYTLDSLFTMEIGIRTNHQVIKKGPYKLIRHPSYTGYLMMTFGYLIASMHWLAIIPLLFVIGFLRKRMNEEEEMLIKHFKQEYRDYMKESYRLIPYIY